MKRATSLCLVAGPLLTSLGLGGCTYYYPVETPSASPSPAGSPAGTNCRQFTRAVTIDGKDVQAVGYACEQPDGTWRLM